MSLAIPSRSTGAFDLFAMNSFDNNLPSSYLGFDFDAANNYDIQHTNSNDYSEVRTLEEIHLGDLERI